MTPKPEQVKLYLINSRGVATIHYYEESVLVSDDTGDYYDHYYRCSKTGEVKLFGNTEAYHGHTVH